jgi:hypothetical protein
MTAGEPYHAAAFGRPKRPGTPPEHCSDEVRIEAALVTTGGVPVGDSVSWDIHCRMTRLTSAG